MGAVAVIALLLYLIVPLSAEPTTRKQATDLVTRWLRRDPKPLGSAISRKLRDVQLHSDDAGLPAYFVVRLDPSGFVVVAGDDLVEPIVCFSTGYYDSSPGNPLYALLEGDLRVRVRSVRERVRPRAAGALPGSVNESESRALGKWRRMLTSFSAGGWSTLGLPEVSDLRVSPLIQTKWGQSTICGEAGYNYYTPPGPDGSSLNYPAGCVATAMAQLMLFHQHPLAGVGTAVFDIEFCGELQYRALRGGDGAGGPYSWSDMVLDPDCSTTLVQRTAIAALCHDAGVAAHTNYCSGASGTYMTDATYALRNTFHYSNSKCTTSFASIPLDKLYKMINPNLHAGFPVILGITRTGGGHAVVCDGYGYNASTQYHHLNMGWEGTDDVWYDLPNVDTSIHDYDAVSACAYNVYVAGTGEIISGRVTDTAGNPIAGAAVTAEPYSDATDARGLYALVKVPSNTSFAVQVHKDGYLFASQSVTTGRSQNWGDDTDDPGNLWGVDFVGREPVKVGDAKKKADSNTVGIAGVAVTAAFGDWFYVESLDRSSGILVEKAGHGLSVGRKIDLIGVTNTNADGERYIEASTLDDTGQAEVAPLGMWSKVLGGSNWHYSEGSTAGQQGVKDGQHLNNIGILVAYWGTVTYSQPGSPVAYVDDGAGIEDGNNLGPGGASARGVRIILPSGVTMPTAGSLVRVVGISSIAGVNGAGVRAVKVREQSDIRQLLT